MTEGAYKTDPAELIGFLKDPVEKEWIDYKDWVDLTDAAPKAKIAADICGLANYGGGYLVFGIREDGKHTSFTGEVRKGFSQDVLSGIIQKYLDLKLQCEMRFVAHEGREHPILWIDRRFPHNPSMRQ